MILADAITTQNDTAKEATSAVDERMTKDVPANGVHSPSYPKRSSVIELWKKRESAIKASSVTSKSNVRVVPFEEKKDENQEIEQDKEHSLTLPYNSKNAPEPTAAHARESKSTVVASPRRSNIRDSWKKRVANAQSFQASPKVEKRMDIVSKAGMDEDGKIESLTEKSRVPINTRTIGTSSNASSSAFDELKSKWAKFGVHHNENPAESQLTEKSAKEESKESTSPITEKSAKEESKESTSPEESTAEETPPIVKGSGSAYSSRAQRLGSKRFRARHSRKTQTASTKCTDDIVDPTFNDSENTVLSSSMPSKKSPDQSMQSTEKESSSTFPLDETIQNVSTPINTATSHDYSNICVPSISGSWTEENRDKTNSTSLNSRANRRLRDMRIRNQTLSAEEPEDTTKGTTTSRSSGLSSTINIVRSKSATMMRFGTYSGSEIASVGDLPTKRPAHVDSMDAQTSALNNVVPDANEMIPDEFVSEKDLNVESFKTAYDKTSFGQIANDMRVEASSLFGENFLNEVNEGVHSAINQMGLGDFFQTNTSTKPKRAPSPVEEVAIEVEYMADSDA